MMNKYAYFDNPKLEGLEDVFDRFANKRYIARGKEMPGFNNLRQEFIKDMDQYYQKLYCFVGDLYDQLGETVDYSFVINLLPLAHQVSLWMHADPKQALYMTHQRVRPGGHINYRDQVWRANMLISGSDPYLSGMQLGERPDPASRDEFFNRS